MRRAEVNEGRAGKRMKMVHGDKGARASEQSAVSASKGGWVGREAAIEWRAEGAERECGKTDAKDGAKAAHLKQAESRMFCLLAASATGSKGLFSFIPNREESHEPTWWSGWGGGSGGRVGHDLQAAARGSSTRSLTKREEGHASATPM